MKRENERSSSSGGWLMISQIFPTIYTGSFKLEKEGTKKKIQKKS